MNGIEETTRDTINGLFSALSPYRGGGLLLRVMRGAKQLAVCPVWVLLADTPLAPRDRIGDDDELTGGIVATIDRILAADGEDVDGGDIDMPDMIPEVCDSCSGNGSVSECPVCYGSGEHECDDCGTSHICGRCGGTGYMPSSETPRSRACRSCHGAGSLYPEHRMASLGWYPFAARLIKPFADAGLSARVVHPRDDIAGNAAVAVFHGHGVTGIVMGHRIQVDTREHA
jgi:hypothetical protein